jgi:hypothetical protein
LAGRRWSGLATATVSARCTSDSFVARGLAHR